jgi:hypothetical protein
MNRPANSIVMKTFGNEEKFCSLHAITYFHPVLRKMLAQDKLSRGINSFVWAVLALSCPSVRHNLSAVLIIFRESGKFSPT